MGGCNFIKIKGLPVLNILQLNVHIPSLCGVYCFHFQFHFPVADQEIQKALTSLLETCALIFFDIINYTFRAKFGVGPRSHPLTL